MSKALKVSVISPEATLFEGEAPSVTAPAFDGEVGILPQHAPMVTTLGTGVLRIGDGAARFQLIILDPPKFAPTAAQVKKAARAYKDINLWALKLLAPGGLLATFSCSGGVSAELFQSIVAGAALDAGAEAKIVERFGAAADHPVALEFPEGDYLKGLLVLKG